MAVINMANLRNRGPRIGLLLIGCFYLAQLASPLRLNTDAIYFLSLSQSFLEGQGLAVNGKALRFPAGYPLILAALDRIGIASSAAFISVNLLFVGTGIISLKFLLQGLFGLSSRKILAIICMTLLSFVFIKHITIPLSDPPYFGISLLCLWMASSIRDHEGAPRFFLLAGTVIAATAAIAVRTVGIALIPPVLFAIFPIYFGGERLRPFRHLPERKAVWVYRSFCLLLLAGISIFVFQSLYFQKALQVFQQTANPLRLIGHNLMDWGELAINIPSSRIPPETHPGLMAAGGVAFYLFLRGIWLRRNSLHLLDIYTISYVGIMIIWPYRDARFWLPVLPLMMVYAALYLDNISRFKSVRLARTAYIGIFCLVGVAALTYSTWISLSGDRFPERYGDYKTRQSYRFAFGTQGVTKPSDVNCSMVRLLNRYERRSRRNCPKHPRP